MTKVAHQTIKGAKEGKCMTHVPNWAAKSGVDTQRAAVSHNRTPAPNDERQLMDGMPFYGEDFQGGDREHTNTIAKGLALTALSGGLCLLANSEIGMPKATRSASRMISIGLGIIGSVTIVKGAKDSVCEYLDFIDWYISRSEEAWEA